MNVPWSTFIRSWVHFYHMELICFVGVVVSKVLSQSLQSVRHRRCLEPTHRDPATVLIYREVRVMTYHDGKACSVSILLLRVLHRVVEAVS